MPRSGQLLDHLSDVFVLLPDHLRFDLTLGFSHPISYELPDGVKAEVDKEGKLHLSSADKAKLGSVAADIRRYRPPEPYKGKGVRYVGERIVRKEGNSGKK